MTKEPAAMSDLTLTPAMIAAMTGLVEAAEQGQPARDADLQRKFVADRAQARKLTSERYAASAS